MKLRKKTIRFLEFAIIGVLMGVFEDTLAVYFVTGERITFHTVWIVFLVALPFAFFSEYVVDHPRFWEKLRVIHRDEGAGGPGGKSPQPPGAEKRVAEDRGNRLTNARGPIIPDLSSKRIEKSRTRDSSTPLLRRNRD